MLDIGSVAEEARAGRRDSTIRRHRNTARRVSERKAADCSSEEFSPRRDRRRGRLLPYADEQVRLEW